MQGVTQLNTMLKICFDDRKQLPTPKPKVQPPVNVISGLETNVAVQRNNYRYLNINKDEDLPLIKKALETYIKIEDEHTNLLPVGCYVRLLNRENGNLSKSLRVFKQYPKDDPETNEFILLGVLFKQRFFKYRRDKYVFFVKDKTDKELMMQEKDNLYRLYKSGLLKIMEDEDDPNMDFASYCDEFYCDN